MKTHIRVGDYIILNVVIGKRVLAKCVAASEDGKKFKASIETAKTEPEPPIQFKASEVVANLGHSPNVGSVYGVVVEPIRERIESPFWGELQIHYELDDAKRKTLRRIMSEVQAKLKATKIPQLNLVTQIKTQTGSIAGMYRYKPKSETDILCVKMDEEMSDLAYRFAHEYAHGIWYRHFTPKMRMAWVNMFHNAVTLSSYSNKDLKSLLEDLKTNGDLRSFMKENPDDLPTLRAIFRFIKQTHSMERNHFEMALMLGEDVDQYWPTQIELGAKETILTPYATKSPEELFAEAYSLNFICKKLPGKVSDLLTKCMSRLVK